MFLVMSFWILTASANAAQKSGLTEATYFEYFKAVDETCYMHQYTYGKCAEVYLKYQKPGFPEWGIVKSCSAFQKLEQGSHYYDVCVKQGVVFLLNQPFYKKLSPLKRQLYQLNLIQSTCQSLSIKESPEQFQKDGAKRAQARLDCYQEGAKNAGGDLQRLVRNIQTSSIRGACSSKVLAVKTGEDALTVAKEACVTTILGLWAPHYLKDKTHAWFTKDGEKVPLWVESNPQ